MNWIDAEKERLQAKKENKKEYASKKIAFCKQNFLQYMSRIEESVKIANRELVQIDKDVSYYYIEDKELSIITGIEFSYNYSRFKIRVVDCCRDKEELQLFIGRKCLGTPELYETYDIEFVVIFEIKWNVIILIRDLSKINENHIFDAVRFGEQGHLYSSKVHGESRPADFEKDIIQKMSPGLLSDVGYSLTTKIKKRRSTKKTEEENLWKKIRFCFIAVMTIFFIYLLANV